MLFLAKGMEKRIIENIELILNLGILSFEKIKKPERKIKKSVALASRNFSMTKNAFGKLLKIHEGETN